MGHWRQQAEEMRCDGDNRRIYSGRDVGKQLWAEGIYAGWWRRFVDEVVSGDVGLIRMSMTDTQIRQ